MAYVGNGINLSCFDLIKQLPDLKMECEWLSKHSSNEMLATADLPHHISEAIKIVLERHPEYKTHQGALGKCVDASDELLFYIDQELGVICDGYMDGVVDYNGNGFHNWAVVEGYCIDLTARQFDKNDLCPKIWPCPKGSS
jgi:hypothetical protein